MPASLKRAEPFEKIGTTVFSLLYIQLKMFDSIFISALSGKG